MISLNSDTSRITLAAIAVLIVLAVALSLWLRHEQNQIAQLRQENADLSQARDQAQAEIELALRAVNFNNDISKATHDQKQTVSQDAQSSVVYIRGRLSDDVCSDSPVDSLSVKRLHDYANSLRESASSTAPR